MNEGAVGNGDIYVGKCRFGRGLFTGRDFRKGETLFAFTGHPITLGDAIAMGNSEGDALQTGPETYLQLDPLAVLANHSCEPNAGVFEGREARAMRDLAKDEEIFYDYSTTMSERRWTMDCQCGRPTCRGVIKDFHDLPVGLQQIYLRLGAVQPFIIEECERAETSQDKGLEGMEPHYHTP